MQPRMRAVEEYRQSPIAKRVPLVVSYCVERALEAIPGRLQMLFRGACSVASQGCLLLCTAVPFVYVYRRDGTLGGGSVLSADRH